MGNKYRNMADVELTCRLFKDVEENSKEFIVVVHITDSIYNLKCEIYEKVKKSNKDFLEIEADDLKLWKVEIDIDNNSNEEFSNLVLNNDKTKNATVTQLQGKVGDFWEENLPKGGNTHVIINSPLLVERRQNRDKEQQIQDKDEQIQDLSRRLQNTNLNNPEPIEETDKKSDVVEVDDDPNVAPNTGKRRGKNILKRLYDNKKIKEGDEVKYGKDHICFLTLIDSVPCIMYNKKAHYSIYSFLQEYLKDNFPSRDSTMDPYQSERRPFSIRGIKYDELKDM